MKKSPMTRDHFVYSPFMQGKVDGGDRADCTPPAEGWEV